MLCAICKDICLLMNKWGVDMLENSLVLKTDMYTHIKCWVLSTFYRNFLFFSPENAKKFFQIEKITFNL